MSREKTAYLASTLTREGLVDTNATYGKLASILSKALKVEGDTATAAELNALTNPMPGLLTTITTGGTLTLGNLSVSTNDTVYFNGLIWVKAQWVQNVTPTAALTVDTTLTASMSGQLFLIGADSKTATLPSSATVGAGIRYAFLNTGANGTYGFTISPNASDKIMGSYNNGVQKITMSGTDNKDLVNTKATAKNGDYMVLESDGVNGWYIIDGIGSWTEESQTAPLVVRVDNVTDLEIAVAAQVANQTIELMPGDYVLTESLSIPLAASGGGLVAVGAVTITGAAAADEAILVDPAVATGTFEYTLQGFNSIKGGANKIGLHVLNTSIGKKVNVYLKQTNLHDNGTGKALTAVNSDGSNAIRIYADGPGEIDGIAFTPKDAGDRLVMTGYNIDQNLVVAAVDVAATFFFKNCRIPHEGMTGGHATNVISVANCWTEAVYAVPVIPDASDFPDAFSATIYPVS